MCKFWVEKPGMFLTYFPIFHGKYRKWKHILFYIGEWVSVYGHRQLSSCSTVKGC